MAGQNKALYVLKTAIFIWLARKDLTFLHRREYRLCAVIMGRTFGGWMMNFPSRSREDDTHAGRRGSGSDPDERRWMERKHPPLRPAVADLHLRDSRHHRRNCPRRPHIRDVLLCGHVEGEGAVGRVVRWTRGVPGGARRRRWGGRHVGRQLLVGDVRDPLQRRVRPWRTRVPLLHQVGGILGRGLEQPVMVGREGVLRRRGRYQHWAGGWAHGLGRRGRSRRRAGGTPWMNVAVNAVQDRCFALVRIAGDVQGTVLPWVVVVLVG